MYDLLNQNIVLYLSKASKMNDQLTQVHDFWNQASCGEVYAQGEDFIEQYKNHMQTRYELEPYIKEFANFQSFHNKDVLEIGVGMGADHFSIAQSKPHQLTGIDLTKRAIEHTRQRLDALGMQSQLQVDNAEDLSFADESFDIVYSWGVLHHSPNTPKCFSEVHRVLKKGGIAKIMIYHKYSPTGFMLWLRYALLKGSPFTSLANIYDRYLESPGTKAYTVTQAQELLKNFSETQIETKINFGDLLQGEVGQRHQGILLNITKKVYPRTLIKLIGNLFPFGLMLLITAKK